METAVVGLIMGSDSDWPVVEEAAAVLDKFGVPWSATVASAHRTPERAAAWAGIAERQGMRVIIAAAGLAAHLPGIVAAHTTLPVIGLPVAAGSMTGLDALYSIVQMPPGVPVATVGIGAGRNAGLLAVQIAAAGDTVLRGRLADYKQEMSAKVVAADGRLQQMLTERRAAAEASAAGSVQASAAGSPDTSRAWSAAEGSEPGSDEKFVTGDGGDRPDLARGDIE